MTSTSQKRILIAPLNWGLGHATRCIPIIKALVSQGLTPIIASDGAALALLRKEFETLTCIALPSYQIRYSKNAGFFKLKMLQNTPKILRAIKKEHRLTSELVKAHQIDGIISDNRFGVYHEDIPSVFITHQLQVLSGNTTWLSTRIQHKLIKRFDACWVPDVEDSSNLSGRLGHGSTSGLNIKYVGPLSRFSKKNTDFVYDLLILLSGPEPQRTLLEEKLLKELANHEGQILLVKGKVEEAQEVSEEKNWTSYNFMTSSQLEQAINASKLVVSRSGYTSIMDLSKLDKKAFFIPTPGQFEQEYLARRMAKLGLAPFCKQSEFNVAMLVEVERYKGLSHLDCPTDFKSLFSLFERE
ncbi:glycosyltransferase [Subsaximicrobium wynnwilliamsii]|uniref:Glycosyltransferase n=1 Tax=Subsaximicrobium wynnwilliamsii TaxID=291179 RepID=A0A5C6ZEH1_9FLAO|nr:glycosyltransferase [Subsaximicrobium wynnwilliamsii]TXD82565.1 glycosyltransferase [Subsaximicrobium wynnwilliamsii]TXD88208.1 glycosyltransferase [Subsaximicrobium wynnwilliamsii]TXE02223.1 glycosyltransferase [Subsaximicrobium wynnwilliamsii]